MIIADEAVANMNVDPVPETLTHEESVKPDISVEPLTTQPPVNQREVIIVLL